MHAAPTHESAPAGSVAERDARLAGAIDHAAHLLPEQGPITVFVHHNTLHAFEDLTFHEAVQEGGRVFGCEPYLAEDRYREALGTGRIRFGELQEVLEADLGRRADEPLVGGVSRLELRLAMLQYPLRTGPTKELLWYIAEADALSKVRREVSAVVRSRMIAETRRWVMRDLRRGADPALAEVGAEGESTEGETAAVPEGLSALLDRHGEADLESWDEKAWEGFALRALWRVCLDGVRGLPPYTAPPAEPVRHRDLLLEATGEDADAPVNALLTRFCAAYLDQGLAHWALPGRDAGFYGAFLKLYRRGGGPPDRWMRGLPAELARLDDAGVEPLAAIAESLEVLGVPEQEWDAYLSATFLALRGWGGMLRQTEVRGDRVVLPSPPGSLRGMLAVRLILDRFALAEVARTSMGYDGPLSGLRGAARQRVTPNWPPGAEPRAFTVFQLAQVLGLSPDLLYRLGPAGWSRLVREVEEFGPLERRRLFHLAYELRFNRQTLDAVALHADRPPTTPAAPRFQAMFCIDEREESIRRHLEEVAPEVSTYGTAGFFSVAMYYKGASDAHFVPLCPPVIRPAHWVEERVEGDDERLHRRRAKARKALGLISHRLHSGSRSLSPLSVLEPAAGVLAAFPLAARTLFPRATARVRRALGRVLQAPPRTRLVLERTSEAPGPGPGAVGFTVDEMAAVAEKVLREIGLLAGFSRLVLVLGHGSNSQNNPHKSAYDCGACGGAPGGPNARALAQIYNDPRIRERLAARGVVVPASAVFVGGMHNTSNDSVTLYDLDLVPASHRGDIDAARADLERACDRDAHERSRRFRSAPLNLSFAAARLGVEARSEDMAQARPEWGHMTNALCVVGRRETTRGLFLDRRAFLTSYDPTLDDDRLTVLDRILSAVVPVCAGINLEYYFSSVDNAGWGCGTKLPHNIVSLLGVMDGAASDLRTGLPWQMIEFHEPVRLLFVIEVVPEALMELLGRNAVVGRLCRNEWVRLATVHPGTRAVSLFEGGAFRPFAPQARRLPRAPSSVEWYRGWRDHLEFAEIGGNGAGNGVRS